MTNTINGFSPNEVVELYHYLCVYVSKLEHLGSQDQFEKHYPKLKGIKKVMSSFVCNYCTIESLKTVGIVPMENLVSMTKCRTSKTLSFLHHLRNSIAHSQLKKEGEFVEIIDYKLEKGNKVFSASGKVHTITLFEILSFVNNNISLE